MRNALALLAVAAVFAAVPNARAKEERSPRQVAQPPAGRSNQTWTCPVPTAAS